MSERLTVAIAMKPDVAALVLPPAVRQRLSAAADVIGEVISDFTTPTAHATLAETNVLLTGWGCPPIGEAELLAAPVLKAIAHAAGSVKGHLCEAVWQRGILVSSAAQVNAYPVAQYTVSVILLAGKRAFQLAHAYRLGQTARPALASTGNHSRVAGVVGASRIGRIVIEMLAHHGFKVLVSDPTLGPAEVAGAQTVELDELMRRSDVVTLHAPALPETHHLIDDRRLGLMRDGAILVNTARGQLVDTGALTRHCASGRIDAVLDVTDPEPLPAGHPLLNLPNVLVTPHVAGAMGNEVRQLGEFAVAEIERLSGGLALAGQIHESHLALMA